MGCSQSNESSVLETPFSEAIVSPQDGAVGLEAAGTASTVWTGVSTASDAPRGAPASRIPPDSPCSCDTTSSCSGLSSTSPDLDDESSLYCLTAEVTHVVREKSNAMRSKLRTDCRVKDLYSLTTTLGCGGFSVVRLAVERSTSTQWACKIMNVPLEAVPGDNNSKLRAKIFHEIDLMCQMEHENVVYLKEYFVEGTQVYIITELLVGGDLLDCLHCWERFSEPDTRRCFQEILKGLEYVHSRNVMHRDVKLENILLVQRDDVTKVKIADFGLAKEKALNDIQSACGTPQFTAPEVILGLRYNTSVDMWGAGVVLFTLLSGFLPFYSDNRPMLFDRIRRGDFSFEDAVWVGVSDSAKDLICSLLKVNPAIRLTATNALQHEWMTAEGEL